jgi:hypothetical protein
LGAFSGPALYWQGGQKKDMMIARKVSFTAAKNAAKNYYS